MDKIRFAYHNLGCKVNAYEMQAMISLLEQEGYVCVDFSDMADVYIINTCSVTNMADKKSRQMIHRAKRKNPDAIVVAVGCYIQTVSEDELSQLGLDLAIGNNKKGEIATLIRDYIARNISKNTQDIIDINKSDVGYEPLSISKIENYTRAFIKVQDGCNQFCSYCIIPYARGRVRSRKVSDVVDEIESLVASGVVEFVITGIHVTSYLDESAGEPVAFIDLLERISQIPGVKRIRMGSLEPTVVTEDFAKRLSRIPQICPHFHLSLQSGCDAVLSRMNRKYTTEQYMDGVKILRNHFEHPAITTDVIVGFPGETDEEFEITKQFLKDVGFYEMHIFKYSRRHGTRADRMPDQVDERIKNERSDVLLKLNEIMSDEFRSYYTDRELEVLIEEPCDIDGKTYQVGYTREYVRCAVKSDLDLTNKFYTGKVIIM